MIRKIKLWGNSLGLRIPKTFAKEIGLKKGTKVKMTLVKGKLVIQPAGKPTLKALVDQITPENSYEEMDFGRAEGRKAQKEGGVCLY
jgi:antitoxin MazE